MQVAAGPLSRRVLDGSLPSEQEEVTTAKRAPARFKEPVKGSLDTVPGAYASELDRLAVWTVRGEQLYCGADHNAISLSPLFICGRSHVISDDRVA